MRTVTFLLAILASVSAFAHPFADLSAEEIQETIRIVRESKRFSEDIRYPVIRRQEPAKQDWLSGKAKNERKAYVAIFDYEKSMMTEVMVDLNAKKVLSAKNLPGIKPPVLIEEYERARKIVLADPRWQKAIRERGIALEDAWVDLWAPGLLRDEEKKPGQRILRGLSYFKGKGANFYSRPIEGLVVNVDLSKGKVSSFWDIERPPVAAGVRELKGKSGAQLLKPLQIQQPQGNSMRVDGQEISWYRWKFRWSMDPLQGLQLLHVRYQDGDQERSILYKISLAEMLVPYSAPQKTWSYRNAFDVGEYGLGKTLHPLERGRDVPENAQLFNVFIPADDGSQVATFPGVAFYERDAGVLWKHRDAETGETFADQARQLVGTYMTTVGNYDYGVNYIFHMDGVLQIEVQLTGMLLAKGTALTQNPCEEGCQPLVEKNILAPHHQHFFNFRMDFDVDGARNYAAEMNVSAVPQGKQNPDGNAFIAETTYLPTEKKAVRDLQAKSVRKWKVVNKDSKNILGHPRGYALMPGENSAPFLQPTNQIRSRARFTEHPVWFTVYKDTEMSGAAYFPTTAPPGEGLPRYIANDESLGGKDVVLWYTFGLTHVTRPEEWPIMNMHRAGFSLIPVNFFGENPAF